ncbi:MAG: peptidoglycan-binding protein [Candidatus Pacebacteria bacterium]|nr:peptidoglycan-binding protein [Candidatus Paceibacterota bacterium]
MKYIKNLGKWAEVVMGGMVVAAVVAFAFVYSIALAAGAPITSQMSVGSRGGDVSNLQSVLASNPKIYPEGLVTGYFGPLTQAAVTQFQVAYDLPQAGRVGPLTLAKLNGVIASGLGVDISAPVIFGVSVQNTTTTNGLDTVTFMWNTSEASQAKVFYSAQPLSLTESSQSFTAPFISGSVAVDASLKTTQAVTVSGLQPHTVYYYVVESIDASGNVSVSTPATFTTQ